jgi:hypothetical protein
MFGQSKKCEVCEAKDAHIALLERMLAGMTKERDEAKDALKNPVSSFGPEQAVMDPVKYFAFLEKEVEDTKKADGF